MIKTIFIFIIKLYQWFFSPILKTNCRFLPTCSEYSIQSIKYYGVIKGSFLSLKRISKCHPFGSHGFDPVKKNKLKGISNE